MKEFRERNLFLLFASLILMYVPALSQDKKLKVVSKTMPSQESIFTLISKAENIGDKDPKKALDYLEQALSRSLKEGNKEGEALSYAALGDINYKLGLYSQSADAYLKALEGFLLLQDKARSIRCRKGLGMAYEGNRLYDKALRQYELVLAGLDNRTGLTEGIDIRYRVGGVYEKQERYDEALRMYNEILALEQRKNNSAGIIAANNKIGNIYLLQEKTKEALKHYEQSQEIATKNKDNEKIAETFDKIGNTLRKERKFEEEIDARKKSIELNIALKDSVAIAEGYLQVGKIYLSQSATNAALAYLSKSERLSELLGNLEKQAETYLALSDLYGKRKEYGKALDYYRNYVSVKDSLTRQKETNYATLVSFNDAVALKQKKINLLEKDMELLLEEQQSSRMIIYFLTAGLVIVVGSTWAIYSSSRKRRIANQVLALRSLRSQMNPHFIFNALNSVNNYISRNDERAANKYLSDFSKLMRTVMENSQHEFISLSTELAILKLYLSLEHSRFREKFDYELYVDEEIQTDQIEIPPMLIQPYIENAIWHGLRYKEDKGMLRVNIYGNSGNLKVVVEDNGIGRKRSEELKTVNQRDKVSTGLKNTEARLQIINELYKTSMKVEMEDLYPADSCGTKVTIYITQAKNRIS